MSIAKTKTLIIPVDFKTKARLATVEQVNEWEFAMPGEEETEPEAHIYCGACEVCDAHKVVCRSGECGACEDCLEFIPYDAPLKEE